MLILKILFYVIATVCLLLLFNLSSIDLLIKNFRETISKKIAALLITESSTFFERVYNAFYFLFYTLEIILIVMFIQHFYLAHFKVPTGSMIPKIMPNDRYIGDMISYRFVTPGRGQIVIFTDPASNRYFCKRLIGLPGERIKIGFDNKIYVDSKPLLGELFDRNYYPFCIIENNRQESLMNEMEWLIPKKGDTIELMWAEFIIFQNGEYVRKDITQLRELLEQQEVKKGIVASLTRTFNKYRIVNSIKRIENAMFLLNGKHITGPIRDKDMLYKLILGQKLLLTEDYYFMLGDNSANSEDSRYWGFVSRSRIKGRPLLRIWPLNRFKYINKNY